MKNILLKRESPVSKLSELMRFIYQQTFTFWKILIHLQLVSPQFNLSAILALVSQDPPPLPLTGQLKEAYHRGRHLVLIKSCCA